MKDNTFQTTVESSVRQFKAEFVKKARCRGKLVCGQGGPIKWNRCLNGRVAGNILIE
jgi:hypothetical protein